MLTSFYFLSRMVFGLQLPKFGERNMSLSNNVFQAISVLMVMLYKKCYDNVTNS